LREFDDNRRISVTEDTLHCEEPLWLQPVGGSNQLVAPPVDTSHGDKIVVVLDEEIPDEPS
jgi:hypothetical protein